MSTIVRYAVIGGAGSMGRIVVRDLFETADSSARILVCDYDRKGARTFASSFESPRVKSKAIDIRDRKKAVESLQGSAVIINCTSHHFNLEVMEIALKARAHYVDLGGLFFVTRKQLRLNARFRKAGLTALIGMGASPGITNIMAAYGARTLDSVREIHCRIGGRDDTNYTFLPALPVSYSIKTLLEEFSYRPPVFTGGKLRYVEPMSGARPHNFGKPVGVLSPMYTIHSELATLPSTFKKAGIREVSFKIAFDPLILDRIKFLRDVGLASSELLSLNGNSVSPIDVTNAVVMSQPKAKARGSIRQYEIVRTLLKGTAKGKRVTKIIDCHTAGMPGWGVGLDINTGAPPSIAAQMIAAGVIEKSGVLPPEKAVDPEIFFEQLGVRAMKIVEKTRQGWKLET